MSSSATWTRIERHVDDERHVATRTADELKRHVAPTAAAGARRVHCSDCPAPPLPCRARRAYAVRIHASAAASLRWPVLTAGRGTRRRLRRMLAL